LGLYSHQIDMLKFALKHPKCCFLAEMGTGKTRPAILAYYNRKKRGLNKPCLIVAPATVLYNWQNEIEAVKKNLTSVVLYGSFSKREELLCTEADFYIINYDYLLKFEKQLISKNFGMLIVDELTYVKHHTALRTKALRSISKDIPYRLGLTGSPITNTPMDVFSEMLIIDPSLFGTQFYAFRNIYFYNLGRNFPVWKPKEHKLREIADKVSTISIMFRKEDCLDLPPVVFEQRFVEVTPKIAKAYDDMNKRLIVELDELGSTASVNIVLTKIMRLAQITSGFIKSDDGYIFQIDTSPKIKELMRMLESELYGRKVIVWCRFIHTIETLVALLEKEGYNPAVLYGKTKDKQGAIDKFQNDESCKVFVGQIGIGFGFNLTASNIMIYIENDFSVENRIQTLARNNRIGQTSDKLTVIDLVVDKSIDTYMLKMFQKNMSVAEIMYGIINKKHKEGRLDIE